MRELGAVTVILLLFLLSCTAQQYEGDACYHQRRSMNGVCTKIIYCQSAIQGLYLNVRPQTCGFEGAVSIVCCPDKIDTQTDVSTTTTTESSVQVAPKQPNTPGYKSQQKCKEYAGYVFEKVPDLSLGLVRLNKTVDTCGVKPTKLIVGGERAEEKEFPHMALLGYDDTSNNKVVYYCGGTIVSELYVLTAAHCLYSRDFGEVKYVRLGEYDKERDDDGDVQNFKVAEIMKHEDYKPPAQYNDIGLVKLDRPAQFTAYVRPICLYTEQDIPTAKAIATGWGRTEFFDEKSSDILLKVTLDFFTNQECREVFTKNNRRLKFGIVEQSQICAGSKTESKDTCQGDSGGPLQIYNTDEYCMYYQLGITSFGKACGIAASPGVFTKVANYIKWIEDIVWP